MDLNLNFDTNCIVESPTFILTKLNGDKIGLLDTVTNISLHNTIQDAPTMSLRVYKQENDLIFNQINMFKLIYVKELNTYFSIECETQSDNDGVYKNLTLTRLGESELSKINVYGLEINTEESIILPDYDSNFPVVLYRDLSDSGISRYDDIWESDPDKYTIYDEHGEIDVQATKALRISILKNSSLLHKILSYAPHYHIGNVDSTIVDIQRIFSFNGLSVLECLNQVAEEISLFIDLTSNESNGINRVVNVYDALSTCQVCGYRGNYTNICPKCGSLNITEGFGNDTTICVSKEILGNELTISRNSESIANCYHLEAGDELMTATVRQCNPNGTGYFWSFSNEMKSEMSDELAEAITDYEELYSTYQTTQEIDVTDLDLDSYNALVEKYRELDENFKVDPIEEIIGYPQLIKAYYDALNFGEYLKTSLLPSIHMDNTTAADVIKNLTSQTLSPVAVASFDTAISEAAVNTLILNMAKVISNATYEITISSSSYNSSTHTWTGKFTARNFYDKDDIATSKNNITILLNEDYHDYIVNKLQKSLYNSSKGTENITNMYNMTSEELTVALKKYAYDSLVLINECFNGCLEILSKLGLDKDTEETHEEYTTIFAPIIEKVVIIQTELNLRTTELAIVWKDVLPNTSGTEEPSILSQIQGKIAEVQNTLNFENYLGNTLWIELNAFRKEADFSNDQYVSTSFRKKFDSSSENYISDSLTDAEMIQRAYDFLIQAERKISENNKYSFEISTTLQNLLFINEFAALRDSFKCGNWIRIKDDEGLLYKLRLVDYDLDFDSPENISVNFSDISKTDLISTAQNFMMKAQTVVDAYGKNKNETNSNFVKLNDETGFDADQKDSFIGGDTQTDIEIVEGELVTNFNVLNGKIEGKISEDEAISLISQELETITLMVENREGASTITIRYNGIDVSTSGDITLGGNVVFKSNLSTAGETIINGENIVTGVIKSANYVFRDGQRFSDSGSLFDLINGNIRTPGLFSDGQSGILYIKEGGYIGDSPILTLGDDGTTLEHAHNAWKLRSAPTVGSGGQRYYTSMTKHRNLIVSDDADAPHSDDNDTTSACNVGMSSHPWNRGYFNRLYSSGVALGCEYFQLPLTFTGWTANTNDEDDTIYYTQIKNIIGIIAENESDTTSVKQFLQVAPTASSQSEYYNCGIIASRQQKNKLTFSCIKRPTNDLTVYVVAQNVRPMKVDLNAPAEIGLSYSIPKQKVLINWLDPKDEMFASWCGTRVIRKKGSKPVSKNDYDVIVVETTTRDQYAYTAYEDSVPEEGIYYYGVLPQRLEYNSSGQIVPGDYTFDDGCIDFVEVTFTPIEGSTINSGTSTSNSVTLNITFQEPLYEESPYVYRKLLYKIGSAPEDITDGTVVELSVQATGTQNVTVSGLTAGTTYYFVLFEEDEAGRKASSNAYNIATEAPTVWNYDYTGNVQTFTAPVDGTYKLEVWGAQGVPNGYPPRYETANVGGYSVGEIDLTQGTNIYIGVGGKGNGATGGWNGGGDASPSSMYIYGYAGGGATHMAYNSGTLASLENNKSSVIIVAGGGGGCGDNDYGSGVYYSGGCGGGYIGGYSTFFGSAGTSGSVDTEYGGGQTAERPSGVNHAFGRAARGSVPSGFSKFDAYAGGGGGWYGGYSAAHTASSATWGSYAHAIYATGGSGYIAHPDLTNKCMYMNTDAFLSSATDTKTVKATGTSTTPQSGYCRVGNGYARITYLSA